MKYSLKRKRASLVLCDSNNFEYKPTVKGVKMKFAINENGQSVFQFFVKDRPVSPMLLSIDVENDRMIGQCLDGTYVAIDFENQIYSDNVKNFINSIAVGLNDEIYFLNKNGKLTLTDYDIDRYRFGNDLYRNRHISSIVGIRSVDQKVALLDTETKQILTGFDFVSGNYDIVNVLNDKYNSDGDPILLIQSELSKSQITSPIDKDKMFTLVTKGGKLVAKIKASEFLWEEQVRVDENANDHSKFKAMVGGDDKGFDYIAFKAGVGRDHEKTVIFKVNEEVGEVVHKYEVPFVASLISQPEHKYGGLKITVLADRSLLLITKREFQKFAGYGAVRVYEDGRVETLVSNECAEVTIHDGETGSKYIDYKKGKTFGRVAVDSSKHTFETSASQFVKLTKKYFPRKPKTNEAEIQTMSDLVDTLDTATHNIESKRPQQPNE